MTYSDSYATGIYWRSKSDRWMIRLVYEAQSIPKAPPTVVARVVIYGAQYPVSVSIDGRGTITFDNSADVPQYVRDKAAYILRQKYDRLMGYNQPYQPREKKPKAEKPKPQPKPEPPRMVAPPRDSRGRFLSWDDNPYRVKPERPKGKTKPKTKKTSATTPTRNSKGQFVGGKGKGATAGDSRSRR